MTWYSVARHHDIFLYISLIWLVRNLLSVAKLYNPLWVWKSCGCTEHYRSIILLTQLKCILCEILCLLAVWWLNHRNHGCSCNKSWILLILRWVHYSIVRCNKYHTSVHTCVCCCEQWIWCNIHTYVLHRHYGSYPIKWCTNSYLCGNLFIWWPFWVNVSFILHHVLTDLCTWCSRICRWHLDTCFITASCNGCVTKHNLLLAHESYPFCLFIDIFNLFRLIRHSNLLLYKNYQ